MSNKTPILRKLSKRYSIYRKENDEVQYINLPDDLKRTDFPLLLFDFGTDKILDIDSWKTMYNLSLKM